MAQMTPEQRAAFLAEARIAKLVTLYPDGSPTAVPVWFEWDRRQARIFTGRDSEKVRRIRADPRVCLTVDVAVGETESWVTLEGTAAIEEHGAIELARRLAPRYYDAEKAARTLRDWEREADDLVVVAVTPRRIRSLAPE